MKYLVVENIYVFFKKNLNSFKLLRWQEKLFFIIIVILCLLWFSILIINNKKEHETLFWCTYIASIISMLILTEVIRNRIIKEYNLKKKDTSIKTCFYTVKSEKLTRYIEDELCIKTKKQKEILIDMIKSAIAPPLELRNIWIIGLIGALSLPIWNTFIEKSFGNDIETIKNNIKSFSVIILFILIFAIIMHLTIINNITYFLNFRTNIYKQIVYILQEDLLFNHYNITTTEIHGEIILKKKE